MSGFLQIERHYSEVLFEIVMIMMIMMIIMIIMIIMMKKSKMIYEP
jgi:type IV secretory pathway component VirB8